MSTPTAKERKRIRQLHALLGSPHQGERENAHRKLEALLKRLGASWTDLPELLKPDDAPAQPSATDPRDSGPHPFDRPDAPTVADMVRHMLETYVMLQPHEYVAVSLWIVHSHLFDQFMVSPRLLLSSPVRGCGKTTLLDVAERLVARPEKSDNITAAAIYHSISRVARTLLLDEADNLEMSAKAVLRAVFNSGYRRGGSISRLLRGAVKRFPVFSPIALAGIGTLTLPLMSRSITIHMRRHDAQATPLSRFDAADTADLDVVYSYITHWVKGVSLDRDPDMPAELHGRPADNWRPLISIADACGPAWSVLARNAAVAFAGGDHDEDLAVVLLWHIRDIFDARDVDRLSSKALTKELIALESADDTWTEYRGPTGGERPRRLTQNGLARLLRPFGIKPRTFWPLQRRPESLSARGYLRADFEEAWSAYCSGSATPSQPKHLHLVK